MADDQTMRLWTEPGQARIGAIAWVATRAPIDKTYAYAVPDALAGRIQPGQRVTVPLGPRGQPSEAFVLELGHGPWASTLRPVSNLLDDDSWLSPGLLELGRWMAEYYATPLGVVLSVMVPAVVRRRSGFSTVRLVELRREAQDITASEPRLGPAQRRLLAQLPPPGQTAEVAALCSAGVSPAVVRSAVRRGWLEESRIRRAGAAPSFDEPLAEPAFEFTSDQKAACAAVDAVLNPRRFEVLLIQGVSGSGKTEVYMHAIRQVLAAGSQAIVLVPEIALTTQLVHRFAVRFRDVAVLHSGLTDAQRCLTWHAIRAGQRRLIIGTRSAAFAPCPKLGLIVIDEEQDTSYKNQPAPRFHARDVAVYRARQEGIPLLLGSATPALETYHNARRKPHYRSVVLSQRVGGLELPDVEVVDLCAERSAPGGPPLLSRLLEVRLQEALAGGQQAVLFLNQRGYASALICGRCRSRVQCPRCRASLVLHRTSGLLHCHLCHARQPLAQRCADSSCGGRLVHMGLGTQRVEEVVTRRFPQARIARVDSDSMDRQADYERVLRDFADRRLDILIGTQIVAKGLDFPGVSLVGVISADTALFQPDFRANERTFQLVTQVAGRAGRAQRRGRAVIQTLMSTLPALQAAMRHDYEAFAGEELLARQQMNLPPFSRLVRWILQDARESRLQREAEEFTQAVRHAAGAAGAAGAEVFGPHPSPLERIRGRYRYDVLLRTRDAAERTAVLNKLRRDVRPQPRVERLTVDVDPVSML